ncbi:hypothetical protein LSAT2_003960 [Lamellibrachia satsuma]|nr:hypothetical protein LSAT2_003960 [Lamellibrachia satsuma]
MHERLIHAEEIVRTLHSQLPRRSVVTQARLNLDTCHAPHVDRRMPPQALSPMRRSLHAHRTVTTADTMTRMTCVLFSFLLTGRLSGRGMAASDDYESCGADALAGDPGDCHAYTQCFGGRLYRFSCGPNAAFDGATGACVSASLVAGCDVTGSTASSETEFVCQLDGYYPDPTDCRRFLWCSGGVKHKFACPDGLVFNVKKNTCGRHESVVSCHTSVTTPVTDHSSQTFVTPVHGADIALHESGEKPFGELNKDAVVKNDARQSATSAVNRTTKKPVGSGRVDSAKSNKTEHPKTIYKSGVQANTASDRDKVPDCNDMNGQYMFNCPASNGFFRDKSDCRQFFHCVKGVARTLQCPYGFVFNPAYNLCDIPERVGDCHFEASETTAAATPRYSDFQCVRTGRFRHPFDCRQYFECRRSRATASLSKCPVGLVFSAWTEACDRVFNVPECFTYLVEGAQLDGLPYEAVVLSQAARSTAVTFGVVLPSQETFVCPRRGYFASLKNCFTFYECSAAGDVATERHCAADFVFNARTRNCDYAYNVPGCESLSRGTHRARKYSRTTSPGEHTTAQYAGRKEAVRHVFTESADSTSVSVLSYSASLGRTKESVNTNIGCRQESIFPDPDHCQKYFHCQRRRLFHVTCSEGLVFNGQRYRCDDQTTSTNCQTPGGQGLHDVSPTDIVHGELVKVTSKTTEQLDECLRTGYQRSLADCTVFFYCSESIVYELRCADGLAFHVERLRCIKMEHVRDC